MRGILHRTPPLAFSSPTQAPSPLSILLLRFRPLAPAGARVESMVCVISGMRIHTYVVVAAPAAVASARARRICQLVVERAKRIVSPPVVFCPPITSFPYPPSLPELCGILLWCRHLCGVAALGFVCCGFARDLLLARVERERALRVCFLEK